MNDFNDAALILLAEGDDADRPGAVSPSRAQQMWF